MPGLIDELEQIVDRAMHVPASSKVLIDEVALRKVIDQMRLNVVDEAKLAQQLSSERDKVLADARAQARRIIEEAQGQANSRLDEQSAVQLARERARRIVAEAEQDASRLKSEANAYVTGQLGAMENRLQRLLHEVQAGQRYLAQPPTDKTAPENKP
jgi:vacuolar-type H+-ATPase subunit H